MAPIEIFNFVVAVLFAVCFFYQFIFFIIGYVRNEVKIPKAKKQHTYAFFIAAHNEEAVIANLVQSGAITWERNDLVRKGKSWVMDYGFDRILNEYPGKHEAFIIFDADNLLAPDYVTIMNDAFDQGYLALTSYRNSKNFGSSWISAAYSIWFLREARFLNNARMLCGTSCAVSGSGYLVSSKIVEAMHGWDFHTLTEDIQFSTFCAVHGIQIGYAPAEFFDEQPLTLSASIKQRRRWVKGFYQVFFTYGAQLGKAIAKRRSFAAYDLLMVIAPATLLTLITLLCNGTFLVVGGLSHGFLATDAEMQACLRSILITFGLMYVTGFMAALLTTVIERKHIHCRPRWRVVTNLFTFPLFMFTYIPLTVSALFLKVDWVPTPHDISVTLDQVMEGAK